MTSNNGRTALISAWNKEGLDDFAAGLEKAGWRIYASGGTFAALEAAGIEATPTESITGISSLLGGRVKTLHPELHAAILAAGEARQERLESGKPVFATTENVFNRGDGNTYGLELLLRKDVGRISGWIGYSYSLTEYQI